MDERLKRILFYYTLSGMFFVMVLSGIIILKKYGDSLSSTLNTLQHARGNLVRVREEISGLDKALSEIKAMVSPDFASNTPEVIILVTLDDLKTRMKDAVITISGMEYRADEIILPLNIKAEVRDYAVFVNTVGYLQTLRFPFFNISSITLMQNNERTAVSYEIKGTLSMIKR